MASSALRSSSSLRLSSHRVVSETRTFSTTSPFSSNNPPAESPSYIRLPQPPQSDDSQVVKVKGHLPVPRDIFAHDKDGNKTKPAHILRTAPTKLNPPSPSNHTQVWKAQLAEARRSNLDSGLQALWKRREAVEKANAARATRNTQRHREAATAVERDDDRMTRGTILQSVLETKVVLDPMRHERIAESSRKVRDIQAAKREARQESLIDLYMNSSNFIVNESDLKTEIDKIFADDYFKTMNASKGREWAANNAWGTYGPPATLFEMIPGAGDAGRFRSDADDVQYRSAIARQKKIAEEFTGGRMD